MLKNILFVGLGGFAGSVARYLVYVAIDKRIEHIFPISTFTVNVVGSLILGVLSALFLKEHLTEPARLFLAIGFCGSFTTFSTFAYENLQLIEQKPLIALLYVVASFLVGLMMVFAGYYLGKQF